MKENNSGLKSNLQMIDDHTILPDEYADVPELPDAFFTEGQLYRNGILVNRHVYHEQELVKKQLTLKINNDIIDFFERQGVDWQTRINDVLQQYVDSYQTV